MSTTFPLEIITPERVFLSCAVEMVVLPATDGQIGLLPGHCPIVSSLDAGTVDVYSGGQISERISITGGFVEMDGNSRCVVLAESAVAT
jgi:F-type H+-transporting ATPase subunit epsilon